MTNYQPLIDGDNLRLVLFATPKLIKAGAPTPPWWGDDAWCDLGGDRVYGELLAEYDADRRHTENRAVHCPPAVAAAVVWYAGELRVWMCRDYRIFNYNPAPSGRWVVFSDLENCDTSTHPTQHEAAIALILAVAEALGDET